MKTKKLSREGAKVAKAPESDDHYFRRNLNTAISDLSTEVANVMIANRRQDWVGAHDALCRARMLMETARGMSLGLMILHTPSRPSHRRGK